MMMKKRVSTKYPVPGETSIYYYYSIRHHGFNIEAVQLRVELYRSFHLTKIVSPCPKRGAVDLSEPYGQRLLQLERSGLVLVSCLVTLEVTGNLAIAAAPLGPFKGFVQAKTLINPCRISHVA